MDRSDQVSNPEEDHPKQDDTVLTEEQKEHLARRRFLRRAVATTGGATVLGAAATVGGGKAFARSLLYSLSPMDGGGPSGGGGGGGGSPTPTNTPGSGGGGSPTPTNTPGSGGGGSPTPTNTPGTTTGKTCTLNTQAPFVPQSSYQLSESVFVSFTVHNLPAGTYTFDIVCDQGSGDFTTSSKPFMLQSMHNAVSIQQFAAGTASDCATQQGTTQVDAAPVNDTVHGSSDADVQLVVHIQGNDESAGTYSFTGTCKQGNTVVFTSTASATFG
ncbi:MAG TPA: hypothetical protein VH593_00620 [Ktedonobacteraceae bacterium]|jgi:hypothetical protein